MITAWPRADPASSWARLCRTPGLLKCGDAAQLLSGFGGGSFCFLFLLGSGQD